MLDTTPAQVHMLSSHIVHACFYLHLFWTHFDDFIHAILFLLTSLRVPSIMAFYVRLFTDETQFRLLGMHWLPSWNVLVIERNILLHV